MDILYFLENDYQDWFDQIWIGGGVTSSYKGQR